MIDIKEFYILGLPIRTELGDCKFIKVKEYPDFFMNMQVISLSKEEVIYKYKQLNNDGSLDEFIEELEKNTLFEIAFGIPEMRESYFSIFTKVFETKDWETSLNKDNFDYFRQLIMKMNVLREEKINPNPEIQKAIERSKRVKSFNAETIEFSDIVTSIVGFNGLTYDDINEFTIYQLYMTYYRIGHIKNYDTTSLFATVTDKVKIENWSKHIDLYEEESHSVTREEFSKTTGSIFDE